MFAPNFLLTHRHPVFLWTACWRPFLSPVCTATNAASALTSGGQLSLEQEASHGGKAAPPLRARPRSRGPSPGPASGGPNVLEEGLVDWFCDVYGISDRRRVRAPLRRALAALQAEEPHKEHLVLERDILPKLELLEGLSEGLGWKVFARYPEELAHPYATEHWGILAGYLYTTGFVPAKISELFAQHPCLFSHVVRDPDNLRRLFHWLLRELGLSQGAVLRMLDRMPLLLQMDVEAVLKPRLCYLLGMLPTLGTQRAVAAFRRQPEILGVHSQVLQQRVDYLEGLGLHRPQIAAMFAADPAALVSSIEAKFEPTVAFLRRELGCPDDLLGKLITRAGLLTRSLQTVEERVAFWCGLGFSRQQLLRMLGRFPRLLAYPMHEPKYQAKLEFLTGELGLPLASLETFPQYVSYSLVDRIAPRAVAAELLAGQRLILAHLATTDAAFCRRYGVAEETYAQFLEAWAAGT